MTVAAILSKKGRAVVTTARSTTVGEAARTLAGHQIGALVVIDGADRIAGIVSERDIVRALAAGGANVLGAPVEGIMTRAVVTCRETDTVDAVMGEMTRGRFRHLPVVKDDRLDGIVSIGDVVKARIEQVERDAESLRAYIAAA